jgi:uncharacterized membrane protein YvlD (DUF360 family)
MDISLLNINFWILQSLAMGLTALFIPRLKITSFFGATIMVIGLALVNAHLWDAALFFSMPDSFSAHALTLFFANGVIFWVLVKLLPGIEVSGVLPALIAPAVFSVTSLVLSNYASHVDFIELSEKAYAKIEAVRSYLKDEAPELKQDVKKITDKVKD